MDHSIPRIRADFDRGCIGSLKYVGNDTFRGQTMHWIKDDRIGNQFYWFCFDVEGAAGKTLTFLLENMTGIYRGNPHLIMTIDTQPVISEDGGQTWERITDRTHDPESFVFTFTTSIETDRARIAYAHPHTSQQIQDLVETPRASAYADVTTIAQSHEGRDVYRIVLGDAEDESKRHALIHAQSHSGEDAAGYLAEGMVRFLLSSDPDAERIRDAYVFHVIPQMNPDGSFYGVSRYNAAMQDLNREWGTDLEGGMGVTAEPVVRDVSQWIASYFSPERKLEVFLDLHCHGQRNPRYVIQSPDEVLKPLCDEICRAWPIVSVNKNKPHSARWFVDTVTGAPAGTFEISQAHLGDGRYLDTGDFLKHGEDVVKAIERWGARTGGA